MDIQYKATNQQTHKEHKGNTNNGRLYSLGRCGLTCSERSNTAKSEAGEGVVTSGVNPSGGAKENFASGGEE